MRMDLLDLPLVSTQVPLEELDLISNLFLFYNHYRFMHLTNYSVNKFNANFINNSDCEKDGIGSKWSLIALKKFFKISGIRDEVLWKKIEDIIIKTFISIDPVLNNSYEMYVPFRTNCFELLGFDILIDDNLQPWLLETNLSPSLNCDSPLDQKIKGKLTANLFTLIGMG